MHMVSFKQGGAVCERNGGEARILVPSSQIEVLGVQRFLSRVGERRFHMVTLVEAYVFVCLAIARADLSGRSASA